MVDQKPHEKWMERVYYDLDTSKAMLQTGRLVYAVFMCQQAIEKCFKAFLSFNHKEVIPIHNLRRLAQLCGVLRELEESALPKLDFLSSYYINARYKDDLKQLLGGITEKTVQDFIEFSEGLVLWLYQKMK
jgi:HEPN domain-containing protein